MTVSSRKSFLLTSLVLAGAVFGAMTLPLAIFGSEQVVIKVQKEPVFYGELRDVAAPYLGFAAALSLGVAVGGVAMTGWRHSSKKSNQMEERLFHLQQHLKEKEAQLEELKLSQSQLQASGLSFFLEDEASVAQPLTLATPQWEVITTPVPLQELAIASPSIDSSPTSVPAASDRNPPAPSVIPFPLKPSFHPFYKVNSAAQST
jgi:hypothetical protein